jgi:hypothetical protein
VPTVDERGRRLLVPLSITLLSGTLLQYSGVGAGDERVVGLVCPDEDGRSLENNHVMFRRIKYLTFTIKMNIEKMYLFMDY